MKQVKDNVVDNVKEKVNYFTDFSIDDALKQKDTILNDAEKKWDNFLVDAEKKMNNLKSGI